jgi:hypothetical protein
VYFLLCGVPAPHAGIRSHIRSLSVRYSVRCTVNILPLSQSQQRMQNAFCRSRASYRSFSRSPLKAVQRNSAESAGDYTLIKTEVSARVDKAQPSDSSGFPLLPERAPLMRRKGRLTFLVTNVTSGLMNRPPSTMPLLPTASLPQVECEDNRPVLSEGRALTARVQRPAEHGTVKRQCSAARECRGPLLQTALCPGQRVAAHPLQ